QRSPCLNDWASGSSTFHEFLNQSHTRRGMDGINSSPRHSIVRNITDFVMWFPFFSIDCCTARPFAVIHFLWHQSNMELLVEMSVLHSILFDSMS
ncbi:MAG: hypothetical protein AAB286_02460, partial [Pseudomonadota bacterium]